MNTILIIDDNADIRENTAELLELSNYRVFTAVTGLAGFEMARKHNPDIILCDMLMPQTDGHKFLMLARDDEQMRNIPLILFSAHPMPFEFQKDLKGYANSYLPKPFTEDELLKVISTKLQNKA